MILDDFVKFFDYSEIPLKSNIISFFQSPALEIPS